MIDWEVDSDFFIPVQKGKTNLDGRPDFIPRKIEGPA